jgi:hypothetical protein
MKKCLQTCKDLGTICPIGECRYWIDYPQDFNCVFETVTQHGNLTLREVGKRLGLSYVRIKQIEDKALKKIRLLLKDQAI